MLCQACHKRQLTPQEEKTEQQFCYFCILDYAELIRQKTGATALIPPPEMLGRSEEEVQEYINRKTNKPLDLNSLTPNPHQSPQPAKLQSQPQQQRHKNDETATMQMKMLEESSKEPPFEYNLVYNEDNCIKVRLQGPVSEKLAQYVEKFINKLMWDIAQIRMQGSFFEEFLRDPNEPKGNNPFQQSPWGG